MPEKITKLTPSTKERPKPEKPADAISNEEFEQRRREIVLQQREEERSAKSPSQIKGEAQQRFIDKIKELKKLFGKEGENK